MITFIPTPHGAGVRLWGTQDELRQFYETLQRYWKPDQEAADPIELQRDNILGGFCCDIRHAFMGMRTVSLVYPVDKTPGEYYGVEITWAHVIFYFAVLRHNMRTRACSEEDVCLICQAEDALKESLCKFSKKYAKHLIPFLNGAIYCENPYLEQYMELINYEHLYKLRYSTPKEALGRMAYEMTCAIYGTFKYEDTLAQLKKEAKRLGCEVRELTYDYSKPPYDFVW